MPGGYQDPDGRNRLGSTLQNLRLCLHKQFNSRDLHCLVLVEKHFPRRTWCAIWDHPEFEEQVVAVYMDTFEQRVKCQAITKNIFDS